MRVALAVALALGLSACSSWDGSFFGDSDAREAQPAVAAEPAYVAPPPAPMADAAPPARTVEAAPPMNPAPRPASEQCTKLAKERAGDAAYQGEDEDTQRSVYDRTYAGCMDWDAKHAL